MKKILIVTILTLLILAGCAGNSKQKVTSHKTRKVLSADIPLWFYNIPQAPTTGIGVGYTEEMAKEKAATQIALFEAGHIICNFCEYDNERDRLGLRLNRMEFQFTEIVDTLRYQEILNSIELLDSVNIRGDFIGLFSASKLEVPFGKETVTENDLPPWFDDKEKIIIEGSEVTTYGQGRSHTIWGAFEKAYLDAIFKFSRYISTDVESLIHENTDYLVRNATSIESDIIIKNVKLEKLFVIPSSDAVGLQQYKVFCKVSWNQQQEVLRLN